MEKTKEKGGCDHNYECLVDTDWWSDYECSKCGHYYMEEFD